MHIDLLRKLTEDRTILSRGVGYYFENKIIEFSQHRPDFAGDLLITAKVNGSDLGNQYDTELLLNKEQEILYSACSCPAFEKNEEPCKHLVATYMKYIEERGTVRINTSVANKKAPKQKVKTGFEAKILMRTYSEKGKTEVAGKSLNMVLGKVTVLPKLKLDSSSVFLELSLGVERQYIVKSIQSFCTSMKQGESVSYGKQLTLIHEFQSFTKESKPLVKFIMNRYDEAQAIAGNSYGYRYGSSGDGLYSQGKKGMRLSPIGVDEFFKLYKDQKVCFSTGNSSYEREEFSASVRAGNPKIQVEVSYHAEQAYFLFSINKLNFLEGAEHLYILFQNHNPLEDHIVWQCDEDYKGKMTPFISTVGKGSQELIISKEDMADFCADVLGEIKEYVTLRGDVELLSAYTPHEMEAIIYLDAPRGNMITAIAVCKYGEKEIDLYNMAQNAKTGETESLVRDVRSEFRIKMELSKYFDGYHREVGGLFFEGDNDRIFNFVRNGAPDLARIAEIRATDQYRRIGLSAPPKLSVGVSLESDLLKVNFDMEEFPVEELMEALVQYKARKKYHRLKNGQFIVLEDDDFQEILQFTEALRLTKTDLNKGKLSIPKYRAMYLNAILKNSERISFDRDNQFRSLIRGMRSIEDSDYEVPHSLKGTLRDYQKTGFRWLKTMGTFGFSGILADDMGLGKTLQVLSLFLDHSVEVKYKGDGRVLALVVCPASLVLNWEKEIEKFTPALKSKAVIGTANERKAILADVFTEKCPHVLITSYDLLKRDIAHYETMTFDYHIIDEAQNIKNHSTQNAKAVKSIRSVTRFALTGTPVENRLSELWSIFDFLMPEYLYGYTQFKERYERAIVKDGDELQMRMLKNQVEPFILRRLKSSVLKELPEKVESVLYSKMGKEQRKLYMANLAKAKLEIGKTFQDDRLPQDGSEKKSGSGNSKFMILALLTKLRQLCCHPALCYEEYGVSDKEGEMGSAKLETCMELIREACEGGHKILLFSQFTSMLDIIQKQLRKENIENYLLTGSTPKEKRMEMVEAFNENEIPIFLISLKAGGTGLNLTGADVVIHYDPWWNLAAQNQATDRTHRIGQKKSVQVYKLIAEDTIEEKILKLQESKLELAESIISENQGLIEKMTAEELLALI